MAVLMFVRVRPRPCFPCTPNNVSVSVGGAGRGGAGRDGAGRGGSALESLGSALSLLVWADALRIHIVVGDLTRQHSHKGKGNLTTLRHFNIKSQSAKWQKGLLFFKCILIY